MDVNSFIEAFEILAARRGIPKIILSDNDKTFIAASTILANKNRIIWKFNTPRAPWQGGFFERLVKSLKVPLRVAIGRNRKTFEQLRCIVAKIEFLINSRPLTYFSDTSIDFRSISPNDFLLFPGNSVSNDIKIIF